MSPLSEPKTEYERRLGLRRESLSRSELLDGRLSTSRGLVFLIGAGLAVLAGVSESVSPWLIAVPLAVFVALVILHVVVTARLQRARLAVTYYEDGLQRLDDNWLSTGATGQRYVDPLHSYSGDLDLFGPGSLFQLLSRARTRLGEDTLAAWLSIPADPDVLESRKQSIQELQPLLDQRERLALLDAEVHDEELNQNLLHAWTGEPPRPLSRGNRALALVLTFAAVTALAGWLFGLLRISWIAGVLIPLSLYTFLFRKHLRELVETVSHAGSGLAILSQVLELIEQEKFSCRPLVELRRRLDADGLPPSRQIAKLHLLIQRLNNSLQNQFFAPIAFLSALPVHLIHSIEMWKSRVAPKIPLWLAAVGEFEALASIAGYAYEHPRNSFAEIVKDGPCFAAAQIGHPLIPEKQCVFNDVHLGGTLRLILVSGSNMSGKSTLLRTIGTNGVLALAGAPVRAKHLRISPVQLGTAMRIHDSLQDGKSLFYAVISRVKSVVELAHKERPLLFLLDEILQGTNSHDRRVGAEGIIRKLIQDEAIGLVTTHDLALTRIVESLGEKAINCHFQDRLQNGKMTFDYHIHPGVVEKSNALELMRMMGLDV